MPLFGPPDVSKLEAKADIAALIKALEYKKDPQIVRAAARALGRLRAPQAVDALLAALPEIPEDAAAALGAIGDPRAVPALIKMLRYHNQPGARLAAAEALGCLKDMDAVEPLVQIISGRLNMFPDLYQKAEQSLIQMGSAAIEPLLSFFNVVPDNSKYHLVGVLKDLQWAPDDHSLAAAWFWMYQSQWEKCLQIGAPAENALLFALDEFSLAGALNIVAALSRAKSDLALKVLVKALEAENPEVRSAAADALAGFGPAAVEPLIEVLKGDKTPARAKAAAVLGKLGDQRAAGPLKQLVADKAVSVRTAATQALAALGEEDAVGAMLKALGDGSEKARKAAGDGLRTMLDAALPRLLALLADANPLVRREAARVLTDANWQPAADETGAWYWINRRDWDKCMASGQAAVQPLMRVLSDEKMDEHSRAEAARVLGQLGSPAALDGLTAAVNSPLRLVRLNAVTALGQLKQPASLDVLIPLLAKIDDGVHPNSRRNTTAAAAARALAEIGGRRAVDALTAVLGGSAPGDRFTAAEALGRSGDQAAVIPLISALRSDKDDAVRAAAAEALGAVCRGQRQGSPALQPLLEAVQNQALPSELRIEAVSALGALGDESSRPVLEALAAAGGVGSVAAVEALGDLACPESLPVLLPGLSSGRHYERATAAEALVKLYRSGRLDESQKQAVLSRREAITAAHHDHHGDNMVNYAPEGCYVTGLEEHTDTPHNDYGIGVDFPL
jgi:HEAT repeat protein